MDQAENGAEDGMEDAEDGDEDEQRDSQEPDGAVETLPSPVAPEVQDNPDVEDRLGGLLAAARVCCACCWPCAGHMAWNGGLCTHT